jgi:hypothetical protein
LRVEGREPAKTPAVIDTPLQCAPPASPNDFAVHDFAKLSRGSSVESLPKPPLSPNEQRAIFVAPGETEIFLIHKEPGKFDFKRQLAAFMFKVNHNYTGLIFPAAEIPSCPALHISDSNQEWKGLRRFEA